ncbi:phage minor head protein [Pseudodesulfovibrio indicus]|uniref:Head morphogenesis protein n=1 Tax=Pseudodesulfovibrio indicus TaxID=1716143 RepID=A0A140D8X6_9BACT|nr:phage minor head protein [Pseudodesulfovibrio indicus]AMK09643.1 head morphogenesis protein [Pseudodesulfovibrio indicus]TDT86407.1 phage Mu protein F like protein [Pseudodesulfovibrio indicus]
MAKPAHLIPPPKEALAWFRSKGIKPSFDHTDVWREEHASAFTVAKATKLDILSDIRAEVDRALAEGRTYRDFAKNLTPTLQRKGWWGVKAQTDPLTGETRMVQLGSPRRLKVIYETNMRTARSAGQWERIQRTKAGLPYLLYQLGPSREHRPEHVAFHGLLLPVDETFWSTHMPPNGWGCKCHVRQVSKGEYARLQKNGVRAPEPEQEINPDTGLPTGHRMPSSVPVRTKAPNLGTREWVNKRTGEVHRVPVGVDPGWDYNPGAAGRLNKSLELAGQKLVQAGAEGGPVVRELVAGTLEDWAKSPKADFPIGLMSEADAARIGGKVRLVNLSPETMAKQLRAHPELAFDEYATVQDALDRGEAIQDGPRSLVYLLESDGYVVVVKATRTGKALFMTSLRRLPSSDARRDVELRRLRGKQK